MLYHHKYMIFNQIRDRLGHCLNTACSIAQYGHFCLTMHIV